MSLATIRPIVLLLRNTYLLIFIKMAITAQQVKELRDRTGVGMMACQKALSEADGDIDRAIEILREKGEAKAASKADRETHEGQVAIHNHAIVKLLCETDFVARNEKFQAFANELAQKASEAGVDAAKQYFESVKTDKIQEIGENILLDSVEIVDQDGVVGSYVHSNGKLGAIVVLSGGTEEKARDVAMHAVAMNPLVANPEEVPADAIEKEKSVCAEQLKNEGKPEQIIDKIIEGKIKKFCAEQALSSQAFVKDPSQTVQEYLGDAKIVTFVRYEV
ncbi:translation elongation factor Ts [Candidatus Gracilibacteria bacterium]|nr:translation elongation factor Ts [Candidatus Gracilibacteria bacterium]MCF7819764.1 translation elongation factor Ts [Candidatus Gracilibacteria bacterium]